MEVELFSGVPHLIDIGKVGTSALGYLTIAENLPFEIKRVYWTYYAPHEVIRGHHAHKELQQLIFALSGSIEFGIEDIDSKKYNYKIDKPNEGIYIPKLCWRTIKFSHNAVLLCLASMEYGEDDYIREYSEFESYKTK